MQILLLLSLSCNTPHSFLKCSSNTLNNPRVILSVCLAEVCTAIFNNVMDSNVSGNGTEQSGPFSPFPVCSVLSHLNVILGFHFHVLPCSQETVVYVRVECLEWNWVWCRVLLIVSPESRIVIKGAVCNGAGWNWKRSSCILRHWEWGWKWKRRRYRVDFTLFPASFENEWRRLWHSKTHLCLVNASLLIINSNVILIEFHFHFPVMQKKNNVANNVAYIWCPCSNADEPTADLKYSFWTTHT